MLHIHLTHQLKATPLSIQINDDKPKIYAIKGPSGIGKTTILNMIAGLRQPDNAFIQVNKRIISDSAHAIDVKIQKEILAIFSKITNFFLT